MYTVRKKNSQKTQKAKGSASVVEICKLVAKIWNFKTQSVPQVILLVMDNFKIYIYEQSKKMLHNKSFFTDFNTFFEREIFINMSVLK